MTQLQSHYRLALYLAISLATTLLASALALRAQILAGDSILWIDWIIIALKSAVDVGLVARAYIDKSPAEVDPPPGAP